MKMIMNATDCVELTAETQDELELVANIACVIRDGGKIQAETKESYSVLEFDGDNDET